jgi:hypothetical protein
MFVFVENAGEAIVSADAQTRERRGVGDRFGQRLQWSGCAQAVCTPARQNSQVLSW